MLARGADADAVLSRIAGGTGGSVKDSFAELDLRPRGFRVLFEARWIRRSSTLAVPPPALAWHEVRRAADLEQWAQGHDVQVFVPALLDVEDLRFFHAPAAGAGFALNRAAGVVGISNTLAGRAGLTDLWSDMVSIATTTYRGLDLVGYETGADLDAAEAAGFERTGQLRVWMR
jgi:hypothetical protein